MKANILYSDKHKKIAEEQKAIGRYGNLKGLMSNKCREDIWTDAIEYAKKTNDVNGFSVMLSGA